MSRLIRYSAILSACFLLTCCSTLTVRAPPCDPPPIPAVLLQACPLPQPLSDGELKTLYLQMLRDNGPWGECIRRHDSLIAVVQYRDAWCAKAAQDATAAANRAWWKFW